MKIINARLEYFRRALKIILTFDDGREGVLWKRRNGFTVYSQSATQENRAWLQNIGCCDPEYNYVRGLWLEKNKTILRYRKANQRFTSGLTYYF